MARPIKEGMDYFPHDVDAMSDDKIEILRALHGNDGYTFYFGLLERIYRQPDFEYDISDAETIQILCKKLLINTEVFDAILQTALKYACFDADIYHKTGRLTSNGIKKRAESVVKKRVSMREKYIERVSAAETGEETPPETLQSKVKKSKENISFISPFEKALEDFIKMRSKIKRPMTPRAEKMLLTKLQDLAGDNDVLKTAILEQSIFRCWQSIFPLKDDGNPMLKHEPESVAYKRAAWLDDVVRERLPERPVATEDEMQISAHALHLVQEAGYSGELIRDALSFSQGDPFWQKRILNGSDFKRFFEKIYAQMGVQHESVPDHA